MASKISWFNRTLYKKNLTGCWPLWVITSILACLVPLSVWAGADGISKASVITALQVVCGGNPFFLNIYGLIAVAITWRFLHQPRRTLMMHALPLSRNCIFLTGILSSITVILIPYAVACVILIFLSIPVGVPAAAMLQSAAVIFGELLICVAMGTFCAMITGSTVMMVVLYFVFNYLAVFTDSLISSYSEGFLFGIPGNSFDGLEFLSPMVYVGDSVMLESGAGNSTYLQGRLTLAVYGLLSILLILLCWLIYRRRNSESAGEAISVRILRPVFLCGVTVYSALTLGRIFYTILFGFFFGTQYYRLIPIICCMAAGGLIGFLAASMLLKKSFRVFDTKHLAGAAATVAGCIIFCVLLRADIGGQVGYIPARDEVSSVTVTVNSDTFNGNYLIRRGENALMEQVMDLQRELIAEKDELTQPGYDSYLSSYYDYCIVWYKYKLVSGETVERSYRFVVTSEPLRGIMESLQTGAAEIRRLHLDQDGFVLEGVWLENSYSPEQLGSVQTSELLAAIRADMEDGAMPMTDTDVFDLSMEYIYRDPDRTEPSAAALYDNIRLAIPSAMERTRTYLRSIGYDSFVLSN